MDTTYGVLCLIPPHRGNRIGPVDQTDDFLFIHRGLVGVHNDERL